MRIWHFALLPYLPRQQLLAQWRELNAIYANQPSHILINYVYDYPKSCLFYYSMLVIEEMNKRGYTPELNEGFNKYFTRDDSKSAMLFQRDANPFPDHHTDRYLKQCFYNLQEKFDRGQKGFTQEQYDKLEEFVFGKEKRKWKTNTI